MFMRLMLVIVAVIEQELLALEERIGSVKVGTPIKVVNSFPELKVRAS